MKREDRYMCVSDDRNGSSGMESDVHRSMAEHVAKIRQAWNRVADSHGRQSFSSLAAEIADPEKIYLHDILLERLAAFSLEGKSVAQFNCNNGRECISIKKLGAGKCVGFDVSSKFISQARQLADLAGVECEFIDSDIYSIDDCFNDCFDIVFITAGSLCWMPDLKSYFRVARRVLRERGWLLILEIHPFLEMFEPDRKRGDKGLELVYPYFCDQPIPQDFGLDYHGNTFDSTTANVWFLHSLSAIFAALAESGFHIRVFEEYDFDVSQSFKEVEKWEARPPMSFLLLARL